MPTICDHFNTETERFAANLLRHYVYGAYNSQDKMVRQHVANLMTPTTPAVRALGRDDLLEYFTHERIPALRQLIKRRRRHDWESADLLDAGVIQFDHFVHECMPIIKPRMSGKKLAGLAQNAMDNRPTDWSKAWRAALIV
jgi:hypothetical protein